MYHLAADSSGSLHLYDHTLVTFARVVVSSPSRWLQKVKLLKLLTFWAIVNPANVGFVPASKKTDVHHSMSRTRVASASLVSHSPIAPFQICVAIKAENCADAAAIVCASNQLTCCCPVPMVEFGPEIFSSSTICGSSAMMLGGDSLQSY